MSLRPNIIGIRRKKMLSFVGCKDEAVLEALLSQLKEHYGVANNGDGEGEARSEDDMKVAAEFLRKVVMEGTPAGLEKETLGHVLAISTLARFRQDTLVETDSNVWKMRGVTDFTEQFSKRLDPTTTQYLQYLCNGRPLFGKKIETDWNYYAYLGYAELDHFRNAIELAYNTAAELEQKGHLNEIDFESWTLDMMEALLEWVDPVLDEKLDLWLDVY